MPALVKASKFMLALYAVFPLLFISLFVPPLIVVPLVILWYMLLTKSGRQKLWISQAFLLFEKG